MLYVSGYNQEKDLYGVTDTDDNVVTWLTKSQLLKSNQETTKNGFPIRGVFGTEIKILRLRSTPSFQNNMKRWITKAKTAGIFDDFEFGDDYQLLRRYNGHQQVINIPPVKVIGEGCFKNVREVEKKYIVPSSVELIRSNAFDGVIFSEDSEFHFDNLREIQEQAFRRTSCKKMLNFNFPRLELVDRFAFSGVPWLESVTFGDKLERIRISAFEECSALRSVDFGTSIRDIEKHAFMNCVLLFDVVLPSSVEKMGENAFCISIGLSLTTKYQYSITFTGEKSFIDYAPGRVEFKL